MAVAAAVAAFGAFADYSFTYGGKTYRDFEGVIDGTLKVSVVCLFGKGELPSDHDTLEFEVRPANAFGAQGEPIRSEPRSFNPTPCATTLW